MFWHTYDPNLLGRVFSEAEMNDNNFYQSFTGKSSAYVWRVQLVFYIGGLGRVSESACRICFLPLFTLSTVKMYFVYLTPIALPLI